LDEQRLHTSIPFVFFVASQLVIIKKNLIFMFQCMVFNSSSLFMSIWNVNLFWINIKLWTIKRHILICLFHIHVDDRGKEWDSYAWKRIKYELSLKMSRNHHTIGIVSWIIHGQPYDRFQKIIHIWVLWNYSSLQL